MRGRVVGLRYPPIRRCSGRGLGAGARTGGSPQLRACFGRAHSAILQRSAVVWAYGSQESRGSILAPLLQTEPRKGEVMKERIVRSAIRCIAEKGIEETSFEAIGKPLGIGRSHVAYHFKDKGDIIRTAIQFVIAQARPSPSSASPPPVTPVPGARHRGSLFRLGGWRHRCHGGVRALSTTAPSTKITVPPRCHSPHGGEAPGHGLEARPQIAKGKGDEDLFDLAKSLQYLGFGALVDVLTTSGITPGHWPGSQTGAGSHGCLLAGF